MEYNLYMIKYWENRLIDRAYASKQENRAIAQGTNSQFTIDNQDAWGWNNSLEGQKNMTLQFKSS